MVDIMKNTFKKMSRRGIKSSLSRFLSIVSIVALGVGFLAGLLATTPDMKNTANEYFIDKNLYDLYAQSTLGFSNNDIEAIKKLDYISQVMAIKQEDMIMRDSQDESLEARVFYVDFDDNRRLNKFELIEGRLPQKNDECVIEIPNQYSYNTKVNSIFRDDNGKKIKAVGIVKSPMFLSSKGEATKIGKGSIALGIYVREPEKIDTYTAVYAKAKINEDDTFNVNYEKELNEIKKKFKAFGKEQSKKRYEELKKEAQDKLGENKESFNKKKSEALALLAKNENKLKANEKEIRDGLLKIYDGKKQIANGLYTVEAKKKKLINQTSQLKDRVNEINIAIAKIESSIKIIDENIDKINAILPKIKDGYNYQLGQLNEKLTALKVQRQKLVVQLSQLRAQNSKLIGSQKEISAGIVSLNKTKNDLNSQYNLIDNQEKKLNEAKSKLNEGWEKYNKSKKEVIIELDKAEEKIDKAQEKINDMPKCQWYTFTRLDNQGISGFKGDVDKVGAIAKIFPVFFFLVAALVVLTTMTRMIEEERIQVGTLKSLGYSNSIILNHYIKYGLTATVIGSVLGLSVGFNLFPTVISNAYSMMYNIPPVNTRFMWNIAIWIVLATISCVMLTIILVVRKELKEKPAMLMQPKAPVAGKRILLEKATFLWKRLKFSQKVTLRNLFRYKKRFLMTIIGVAGCFALLLTGFGVRNAIGDIVALQYGEIFKYDMTVSVDEENWKKDSKNFASEGFFFEDTAKISSQVGQEEVTIDVPKSDKTLLEFVDLRNRIDHRKIELTDEGLVLSEKAAEILELKVGDDVTVSYEDHDKIFKVSGICENYVQNKLFMTENSFYRAYGKHPNFNTLFTKLNSEDADQVVKDTMKKDGVEYVLATETIKDNFSDSVKNIDYIVLVLIFSAGALSMIVLYNLTNINICERKKELATIKVLGFYDKEVSSYIFREINILTIIGIVVGIPMGIALNTFVIKTAEVGGMMFGREIYFSSYVISIIITILFTVVVNLIMRRSIKKIDMVESMKAND